MMMNAHPRNAAGPFYVEYGCCTACGVPESIAPELFGADDDHCFVQRQPASGETFTMLRVLNTQELGCIRYRGDDPAIIRRIAEMGEREVCDGPVPDDISQLRRNHAEFSYTGSSASSLLAEFAGWLRGQLPQCTVERVTGDARRAETSVCWFEDEFNVVELGTSPRDDGRWLVKSPTGLADLLHVWLTDASEVSDIRWQSEEQWEQRGPWVETPL